MKDILENQRNGSCGAFMWVSRELKTKVPFKQFDKPKPNVHKQEVINSRKIQDLIDVISKQKNVPKGSVLEQIKAILEEIGYNMEIKTLRWLGLALTKICIRCTTGIFVNESKILKLRNSMGNVPVIYVPSHRSYADFILMSYVLFYYDIVIPAIAAGMDFHGMWGMGSMLRDTGAFFMRRSYNDDALYWDTFKQYVYQLVVRGENGIEFFIEGTRSRSNKSLPPKFGLLSMILKAYFNADVPDILFCPINITYDRILEEKLFAFELLGVPKPKESTSGFFKSLSIIKENFGNFYVNFGDPISAKDYFGDYANRSDHNMKPKFMQQSTEKERILTSILANDIVTNQQKLSFLTNFNLVAILLSYADFKLNKSEPLTKKSLISDLHCLAMILRHFGCRNMEEIDEKSLENCLKVHKNVIDDDLKLVKNSIVDLDKNKKNMAKLKAHDLNRKTMELAVPNFMLQLYINPVMHYIIDAILISHILTTKIQQQMKIKKGELFEQYCFLRQLFSKEFVTGNSDPTSDFNKALGTMQAIDLVEISDLNNKVHLMEDDERKKELVKMLAFLLQPFLAAYLILIQTLKEWKEDFCAEKLVLTKTQALIEEKLDYGVHPYALSLDSMQNCLLSLLSSHCIAKTRRSDVGAIYKPNKVKLESLHAALSQFVPNNLTSIIKTTTISNDSNKTTTAVAALTTVTLKNKL